MVEGWFEIREARSEEYESLGEIGALAYGALEGESDLGYIDEVRDVVTRAGSVPILAAVDANGTLLGSVTYVPGPGNSTRSWRDPTRPASGCWPSPLGRRAVAWAADW